MCILSLLNNKSTFDQTWALAATEFMLYGDILGKIIEREHCFLPVFASGDLVNSTLDLHKAETLITPK